VREQPGTDRKRRGLAQQRRPPQDFVLASAVGQQRDHCALLAGLGREHEVLRRTPLLGEPAPFPVGPWLLAHSLRVPVLLCFGLYEGGNRYRLIFEPFADRIEIPRHDRALALDAVIARFAHRVEHYIRVAPYNWFNFYDFWQQDVDTAVRPDAVAVRERVGA
jgi:predicted LPLAT superfamily acyltransferase